MDNKKIIECVWYDSKRTFNKFVRNLDSDSVYVIDYSMIKSKLIKADPYENEPHDSIIGLNIIKMLSSCFGGKKDPDVIVYSFYNMDLETVVNFKELITSHTNGNHTMVLNILEMDEVPSKQVLNKFDCVKFIDND